MKGAIIFLFAVAGCFADPVPVTPAPQIDCKVVPEVNVFTCIGQQKILKRELLESCRNITQECDAIKCFFNNAGFFVDDKISKTKIAEYFDGIASANKDWTAAVAHVKSECLGDQDLPQQGMIANCPSYDIINCAHGSFLEKSLPSQWKNTPECQQAHAYLSSCVFCPDDLCQVDSIAPGTCNACKILLKSS